MPSITIRGEEIPLPKKDYSTEEIWERSQIAESFLNVIFKKLEKKDKAAYSALSNPERAKVAISLYLEPYGFPEEPYKEMAQDIEMVANLITKYCWSTDEAIEVASSMYKLLQSQHQLLENEEELTPAQVASFLSKVFDRNQVEKAKLDLLVTKIKGYVLILCHEEPQYEGFYHRFYGLP